MQNIDILNYKFDTMGKIEYIQEILDILIDEEKKITSYYKSDINKVNKLVRIIENKLEYIQNIEIKKHIKYDILTKFYKLQRMYYSNELKEIKKTTKNLQKVICYLGITLEFAKSNKELNKEIECRDKINYHIKFGKEIYDRYNLIITKNTLEKEKLFRSLNNDKLFKIVLDDEIKKEIFEY